jgi:hypothetical protein
VVVIGAPSGRAQHSTAPERDLQPDEHDFIGIPGLLSPEETAALLASRDAELKKQARRMAHNDSDSTDTREVDAWQLAGSLRREINNLVSRLAAKHGRPHAAIHGELRTTVPGPPSATASLEVLSARRDHLLAQLLP